MKFQIPNSKSQTNSKFQIPNSKKFGVWCLFGIWCLALGHFSTYPAAAQTGDLVKSQVLDELNRASTNDYVPDEILVKFRPYILESQSYDDTNNVLTTTGVPYKEKQKLFAKSFDQAPELFNIYKVQVLAGADIKRAVTKLNNKMDVEYAEPNYIMHAFLTPNDPGFSQQWGMTKIYVLSAWDTSTGNSNVLIGIVDTGIKSTHPDLNVNNGSSDCNGHGTHCGGIASAITNNSVGVAGVAFQATLRGYSALGCDGSGPVSTVAQEIRRAADDGVKVINLSLGVYGGSGTLCPAVDYAWGRGVVVVASAGNDGITTQPYPAGCTNAIAVAWLNSDDTKSRYSNYGSWVDVSAPGSNIYSTCIPGGLRGACSGDYGTASGTSMSAPHVSGLAGLMFGANSNCTNSDVRTIIEASADNIDQVNPNYAGLLGTGRINAATAVRAALGSCGGAPPATPTPTPVNTPTPTLTPTLTPTPTPTPVITGTPTPTTSITPTITLTPSPTATPTPGPSPTPTPTPTAGPSPTPHPTPTFCGPKVDVNQDGVIDKKDLDTILVNYTNIHTLTLVGDINNDGQVNSIDASMVIACWGWRGP